MSWWKRSESSDWEEETTITDTLHLLAVGDMILGPNAESYFRHVAPLLNKGDVVIGQLEVPYTRRDPGAVELGRDPENLHALVSSNFSAVTLAGNHIQDAGVSGIEDTIGWLDRHNIAFTGAGMNLGEARKPAIVEREGTRFGFLSYNCVGPKESWASSEKPGCAYLHIITHYELEHATPGGPPTIYTWAEPASLDGMIEDIKALRSICDILVVSLHKGLVHMPVKLADYEQEISYAAINAGADLVLGHHAHILKGIELYRGKTIFHGLCNMVAYLPSLAPRPGQDARSWARRRREIFGFEPNPEYPTYPFHPEAIYSIIAKVGIENKNISRVSYIPCIVNKEGEPEVVEKGAGGEEVFEYMEKITREAGLNAKYQWQGDEIVINVAPSN